MSCPSDFSDKAFMIKRLSQIDSIQKTIGISLGTLYFQLHRLCAAHLYIYLYNDNGLIMIMIICIFLCKFFFTYKGNFSIFI